MNNQQQPSPEQLLTDRGVMLKHAKKSSSVLESADSQWADYLAQLINFPASHPNGGIAFILGERGRGKTQMAVCAMRILITADDQFVDAMTRRKWSIRYVSAACLFMQFRDAIKQGRELATLKEFSDPRLLVIDDLHEQAGTDHEHRTLARLVDDRIGAERYTVFVTNNTRKALPDAVGASVAHRYHEAGIIIEVEGRNFRQEEGQP